MKKVFLLFTLILSLVGITQVRADELTVCDGSATNTYVPLYGMYADTNGQQAEFIIPAGKLSDMNGGSISKMEFQLSTALSRNFSATYQVVLKEVEESSFAAASALGKAGGTTVYTGIISAANGSTAISIDFTNIYDYGGGNLLVGIYLTATGSWATTSFKGEESANAAWYGSSSLQLQNFIPKTTFTYEAAVSGPAFRVKGYKDGDSYSFGLKDASTTTTFTLSNPGTEAVTVNIATTGGFTADATTKTIAAKGEETVTVTAPSTVGTSNGTISFTPTASGLDAVTVSLSSTIKDPNKLYEDFTGSTSAPDGWTTAKSSSYYDWVFGTDAVGVGYAGYDATSSSYPGSLQTPLVEFEDGEKFFFKTSKYSSSSYNTPSVAVQVSANGTDWNPVATFTDDVYGTWTAREVTIPSTTKYVRFYGWNFYLTEIYGGQYSQVPVMTVTGATNQSFGMVADAATYTFNIKNTGKSDLKGISVVSDNAAYTITDAPTTLAPSASADVTVTLGTANKGLQEGVITISAPDQETVTFNVSGYVADTDLFYEDFSGNALPDGWTGTGYTFSSGEAYGSSSSCQLTTPALTIADGEAMAIEVKTRWNSSLPIYVSKDGGDFTLYKTIAASEMSDAYKVLTFSGLDAGNYKISFRAQYVTINTLNGFHLNNDAPELTVSPTTAADFGTKIKAQPEAKTYTVKNAGTGTLNVEISSSDDTQFTVTPATLSLGKGESGTIDINLVFDDNYGSKAATITVHPTNDGLSDVTINATGTTADPTVFEIDFEDGEMPADFIAGDNWTVYSGFSNKYARNTNTSGVKTKLISPKLTVAAGESLAFQASYISSSYTRALDVLYSADRKTWTTAKEITSSDLSSSLADFSVDNIPTGEWYIAFDGCNVEIDNINGFHLAAAAATDLYATAQNIPATGMVNSAYTASATFKNLANDLAAADYTAELLFGSDVVATATAVDLAAGASQTFSFSLTPYTAGTYDAIVRLTVGSETFETEATSVTIAEESATDDVVVGTFDSAEMRGAPLPMTTSTNLYGATASIYKAADLGLTAGSKIKSISYYGYYYSSYTYPSVKAYIATTTDDALAEPYDATDVTGMTQIYDGSITANPYASKSLPEKSFSIDLATPFEYTGDNLKIVFVVETTGACSPYFTSDGSLGTTITGVGATADDLTYSTVNTPVLYLNVEKAPVVISGTVTDKATNAKLAGVEVKAQSGDVKYTATTDSNGAYSLSIVKADLSYDFTAKKDGYFPYSEEGVSFTATATKNIQLQEASGLYIAASTIPATGTVNSEYTATVDVQNADATAKAAGDYTVKLYVDGEEVAAATTVALASQETQTFTLSFTPHATGDKNVYVKVEWGSESAQTADQTVNFKAEIAAGVQQVGEVTSTTNGAPVKLDYQYSSSFSYYTPAMLGLEAGTTITGITYKGYNTGTKTYTANMEVYLENTDEIAGQTTPATKVYSGTQTIEPKGTSAAPVDYLVFEFDTPFVYTGSNLKVVVKSGADDWVSGGTTFQGQSGTTVITRYSDDGPDQGSTTSSAIPVMYLSYDASATVSGKVTTDGATAAANATVTLTSGDVIYETKTDANGDYEVKVAQKDKTYTLTAAANGEAVSFTEDNVAFDEGNLVRNIILGESVKITVTSAGYATFSSSKALDFTGVTGLTVYKVTAFTDEKATLEEVTDKKVAANTGILLKGAANDYTVPVATSGTVPSGNLLKATSDATEKGDETTIYALGTDGSGNAGFKLVTSGTVLKENRAYLVLESGSGAKEFIPFDDTVATGIEAVGAQSAIDNDAPMFNLNGQRVNANHRGVVIQNGKKVVRK